jgi:hypothetical protein
VGSKRVQIAVGTKFGRLVTTSLTYGLQDEGGVGRWRSWVDVKCDCGVVLALRTNALLSGRAQSCGCLHKERVTEAATGRYHPKGSDSPLYNRYNGRNFRIAWLRAEKEAPCTDCNVKYPWYVMQFDHVPGRGEKLFELGGKRGVNRTFELLKAERAKCDLVCANCHAERTYRRHHPDQFCGE